MQRCGVLLHHWVKNR